MTNPTNLDEINDPERLLDHYRAELATSWRRKVPDIFKAGLALCDAKKRLSRGHFGRLVAEFDMDRRTSMQLRVIADKLANVSNLKHSQLPPSVSTLYEMAKRGPKMAVKKAEAGDITPETTVEQVRAWTATKSGTTKSKKAKPRKARIDPDESIPAPVRMTAPDRVYHVFDTWDEELAQALGRPGEWDTFEREVARRMLSLRRRAKEQAQELAMFTDVADKPTGGGHRAMPMRDHVEREEPLTEADMEPAMVQSPPTVPTVADMRTPAEIMGEMPEPLRRHQADQPAPPADDRVIFEEDADAADRSSGRPEDGGEWENSSARWGD
jgi:hypothetical protein